jgi:replication factor A1
MASFMDLILTKGKKTMRSKESHIEYLAFLSIKYSIDADEFFQALVSAVQNQKSRCGCLSMECRRKQKERVVILITKGSKVVAQFTVSTKFLQNRDNPINNIRNANTLCRRPIKKDTDPRSVQVKDLRIGMKSVNLKAEVVEIAEPKFVITRFGNYASVANALISDETGRIKLCLWNEQINSVSVGDNIQIKNAKIYAFRGERQVRVGKNGALHTYRNVIAS